MMTEISRIPLANPAQDQAALNEDILAAIKAVIAKGSFILGPMVACFETQMAHWLGVPGAVGVGSGTEALVLALVGLDVRPNDEVITVSHTAGPTVAAIHMVGAKPVLIDIESETYCLDPAKLLSAITHNTKAIIVVHLYGHPAEMDRIVSIASKHGISVIEDCAQAQGATFSQHAVGSLGTVGCFSFYPTKNLGALGDGGLVVSRDTDLVERIRRLRTYGWTKPQFSELGSGRCSRLDELQAAILSIKLASLDRAIERRRKIAQLYEVSFSDLPMALPKERVDCKHAFYLYVIRSDRRDALAKHLDVWGVSTGIHFPYPVHRQPGLAEGALIPEQLQVTEIVTSEILSLPVFPSITEQQQERVINAVRSFFRGC